MKGNHKHYQLLVFDWEGTLSDSFAVPIYLIEQKAAHLGLTLPKVNLLRQTLVFGLAHAVAKSFPDASLHQKEQLIESIGQAYLSKPKEILFDHAKDWLISLKERGYFLAVASNRGYQSLLRVIRDSGLLPYIDEIRSSSNFPSKPAPDMLKDILDTLDVDNTEALMIGDSVTDMEMAAYLSVDSIGIDIEGNQVDQLKRVGAMQVFQDYQSLISYVEPKLKA